MFDIGGEQGLVQPHINAEPRTLLGNCGCTALGFHVHAIAGPRWLLYHHVASRMDGRILEGRLVG